MVDTSVQAGEAAVPRVTDPAHSRGYYLEVFAVSFAGLLLEIAYTRVISFKFFYYWTYLIIRLGAPRDRRRWGARSRLQAPAQGADRAAFARATPVGRGSCGDRLHRGRQDRVNTLEIWKYGSKTLSNLGLLLLVCFAIFISFVPIGVILSTLFGRRPEGIGRLYFFDLVGAGVACLVAVSLISWIGPPATIFLGEWSWHWQPCASRRRCSPLVALGLILLGVLGVYVIRPGLLPNIAPDVDHINVAVSKPIYSAWSPIFRIDVVQIGNDRLFDHDGVPGSEMLGWNGKVSTLKNFGFDHDPRALPFDVLGKRPGSTAIIGAAGRARGGRLVVLPRLPHRRRRAQSGHGQAGHDHLRQFRRTPGAEPQGPLHPR